MQLFWVTDDLAFGPEPERTDVASLRAHGITDVIDLRGEPHAHEAPNPDWYDGSGIAYHYVPMLDRGGDEPPEPYWQGLDLVRATVRKHGKAAIHCAAGISRSPSMVYAVLRDRGLDPDEAWGTITRVRPSVDAQYVASAERAVRAYHPGLTTAPRKNRLVAAILVVGTVLLGLRIQRRLTTVRHAPRRA